MREKTNNLGSDQVQHKPTCTVTEAGHKLEISDLRRRGIVLSVQARTKALVISLEYPAFFA